MRRFLSWLFPRGSVTVKQSVVTALPDCACQTARAARWGVIGGLYEARVNAATRVIEHYGKFPSKEKPEQELYDTAVAFLTMHLGTSKS